MMNDVKRYTCRYDMLKLNCEHRSRRTVYLNFISIYCQRNFNQNSSIHLQMFIKIFEFWCVFTISNGLWKTLVALQLGSTPMFRFAHLPMHMNENACVHAIKYAVIYCCMVIIWRISVNRSILVIIYKYIRSFPLTTIQSSVQIAIVHTKAANIIEMVIPNKTRRWNKYSSYKILRSSRSKPNVEVDILLVVASYFRYKIRRFSILSRCLQKK